MVKRQFFAYFSVVYRPDRVFAVDSARSAAVIFSIIQTARENGLNAYDYLTFVLKRAPNQDILNNQDELDLLLPWSHAAQAACRNLTTTEKNVKMSQAV